MLWKGVPIYPKKYLTIGSLKNFNKKNIYFKRGFYNHNIWKEYEEVVLNSLNYSIDYVQKKQY